MITRESPRLRAERGRAVRAGVRVEQLTIGWMTVEAIVALTAGLLARSVLLTAFGIDSVIELVTGGVLLWLFWLISPSAEGPWGKDADHAQEDLQKRSYARIAPVYSPLKNPRADESYARLSCVKGIVAADGF